jgi:DNA-binding winged helix-turn-helix (wHTH) protein/Tfp pilus assembly protein PilF
MAELRFGPYLLSTEASRLTRDGASVHLRPRAFHALRVLLSHVGAVVDYDTIIAEGWEGVHVSRHTVDVTLAEVRLRLGEYGRWIEHRGKYGYALQVPLSDEFVRQGWHFWMRRPLTMYSRFLEAHKRAVALTGLRPELRCDRAFGLHVFEHRPCEAEAEFSRTLAQKPGLPSTYVRLGLLYGATGRFDDAIETLARGLRVDPLLPTLAATEVLVHCWRRDFEMAVTVGRRGVELHPHLQTVRVNYAQALQFAGRLDEALAQYQIAAIIAPDVPRLRALEGACLAALGRRDEAHAMLVGLQALRHSEYVDAYYMAIFRNAMRRPREAFAELERAHTENSAWLYALDVDPMFDALRAEPEFRRLRRRSRAS